MGHQFDNAGAEESPEPRGFALLLDIAAIVGCGVIVMFTVLGMAVVVMALSK